MSICCRSFSSFKEEFSQDSLKLKTIILKKKKRETDGGERKRRGKRRRSDPDLKARR